MRLALILAALALPLAQACTTTTPSAATLDWVAWDGSDRLGFGFAGQWYVANVTTGEVGRSTTGVPPTTDESKAMTLRSAGDGSLALVARVEQIGMGWGKGCSWGPYSTTVGFDLRRGDGTLLRSWGEGTSWKGTSWSDDHRGYVWDDDASTLSAVDWNTGSVTSSAVAVPPHFPVYPANAPDVLGRQLVLAGPANVTLLDPVGPQVRIIPSPIPEATPAVRGSLAYFSRWTGGTNSQSDQSLEATLVDLASGDVQWHVATSGTWAQWSPRGLVVADGDRVRLWRDGDEQAPLDMDGAGTALLNGRGDFIAIALRDSDPRLVVLGPDMAPVIEVDAVSLGLRSGSDGRTGTPGTEGPSVSEGYTTGSDAGRPASSLAGAGLAVAVAAAALRRRLT